MRTNKGVTHLNNLYSFYQDRKTFSMPKFENNQNWQMESSSVFFSHFIESTKPAQNGGEPFSLCCHLSELALQQFADFFRTLSIQNPYQKGKCFVASI